MEKYLPILRSCPFFMELNDTEILSILHCVNAVKVSKASRSYIFKAGDSTDVMGLVLAGSTLIIQEDLWGHRNILSKCNAGDFFGEPYAATPGTVLNISVVAEEDCDILFLNIKRLLTSCPTACDHHQKLIRNLVCVLANKILILNDKSANDRPEISCYPISHLNPSKNHRFLLISHLTDSNWQIFFV